MFRYHLWRLKQNFSSKSETTPRLRKVNEIVEQQSSQIINLVGYVILFLTLLDYAIIFVSANLFESTVAYNTAGNLVENVWAFLLGFLFIFYRRNQDLIQPREFTLLSFLSWLALVIGIGYFLITPLLVGHAFRINHKQQARVITQINRQKSQVTQYSQQLDRVSQEQLNNLFQNYKKKAPDLEIASAQEFKENLLTEINQKQKQAQEELQTRSSKQKGNLLKTTFKWSIGAIISGMSFILIWRYTKWARIKENY